MTRPVVSGRRVVLRRPTGADRERFLALVRRSRQLHRPWAFPPRDARSFGAFVRGARSPRGLRLLVCTRADGAIVGVVNLNEIVRGGLQSAFIGYYVFAGATGHGYMTEAIGLVLRYAFGTLGLHRIEANVQPGNRRSLALVARCGFRREGFSPRYLKIGGRWRDHERWAVVRGARRAPPGRARSAVRLPARRGRR